MCGGPLRDSRQGVGGAALEAVGDLRAFVLLCVPQVCLSGSKCPWNEVTPTSSVLHFCQRAQD